MSIYSRLKAISETLRALKKGPKGGSTKSSNKKSPLSRAFDRTIKKLRVKVSDAEWDQLIQDLDLDVIKRYDDEAYFNFLDPLFWGSQGRHNSFLVYTLGLTSGFPAPFKTNDEYISAILEVAAPDLDSSYVDLCRSYFSDTGIRASSGGPYLRLCPQKLFWSAACATAYSSASLSKSERENLLNQFLGSSVLHTDRSLKLPRPMKSLL